MGEWRIYGPDKEWLTMPDILAILGDVTEATVRRLIAAGKFPRPIRAGAQSPPRWHASVVGAWQLLQPMLEADEGQPQPPE